MEKAKTHGKNLAKQYLENNNLTESDFQGTFDIFEVEEALEAFEQFKMPSTTIYPLELCILYTADAHRAKCLLQLGRAEEALIYAKRAVSNIDSLPQTPYQGLIKHTLELVNKNL
ncbi:MULTISPECIES: hypothetical protein [unclassified Bacillus (in: firmicutes)]|uniref:hypothetical protein n=1 Tax=unclassified Bacillus (in: firmicutes) TaxID=185979 RepID=UPI00203638A5|nr:MULTISPECIES: hypothetical protein [unclassified Bacillus (in: firmicutes)]